MFYEDVEEAMKKCEIQMSYVQQMISQLNKENIKVGPKMSMRKQW